MRAGMTIRSYAPVAAAWAGIVALLAGRTSVATEATSAGAGIAGAAVAHGVTNNAGVTTGIGLGVQAAARAGLQYAERKIHQTEQDSIATVAGALPVGGVARWQSEHAIPLEADEQGQVTVSRTLGSTGSSARKSCSRSNTPQSRHNPRSSIRRQCVATARPGSGRPLSRRRSGGERCSDPAATADPFAARLARRSWPSGSAAAAWAVSWSPPLQAVRQAPPPPIPPWAWRSASP